MDISVGRLAQVIINWSQEHPRSMPWKQTSDPYKIWVSEIILQQTQVAQGTAYYHAFLRRFPTVKHLANATEDEVLSTWQGLGYNSRARYLHAASRTIVRDLKGRFPRSYDEILALKGVGEYTAAAIASFAFGLPTPVLDTNVIRVLCRVKGIASDPSKRETRDGLYKMLNSMIRDVDPAQFNQAMMNFGAIQCKARNPDCDSCVLAKSCVAFRDGLVDILPIRVKRVKRRARFFHYFVIHDNDHLVIRKRNTKDIWYQMYDFPLIETPASGLPALRIREPYLQKLGINSVRKPKRMNTISQTLTHQEIHCTFYEVRLKQRKQRQLPEHYRFEQFQNLQTFAFPKVIRTFLADNSLHLVKLPSKISL